MNSDRCKTTRIVYIVVAICCSLSFSDGFVSPQRLLSTRQRTSNRPQQMPFSILFLSSVSRNQGTQNKKNKPKNKPKNKHKTKKPGKWDQRRNKDNAARMEALTNQPRPVLTNYQENRNSEINEQRLFSSEQGCIPCPHFGSCPGCVVDRNVGDIEIVRSAARFFSSTAVRKNRIDVIQSGEDWVVEEEDDGFYQVVVPSTVNEWRTQAKLVATPKSGGQWANDGCKFGLYKRGTHEVLEIPDCTVHHPSINRAVRALEKATETMGTPAYKDDNGLRYVQLQVERTTGKINLTLVWGTSDIKRTQPALSRLQKELQRIEPDLWHSMWCHCNDSPGNNIFSRNPRAWHKLVGHDMVREPLPVGDLGWLYFSPFAFRQGNLDGFDVIANDVARAVPGGSKVCELYAGVGMLGLTALVYHERNAQKYADTIDGYGKPLTWIRCSDENPANPRCFQASVRSLYVISNACHARILLVCFCLLVRHNKLTFFCFSFLSKSILFVTDPKISPNTPHPNRMPPPHWAI